MNAVLHDLRRDPLSGPAGRHAALTLGMSRAFVVSRSAWYLGVQLLAVYSIFAVTLHLLPG